MTTFFVTEYQDTPRDSGRDGLGLLPLWSVVARRCIWNLTSISSDLAGWRSLLVSSWLAQKTQKQADAKQHRRAMLAAERLIGVARVHAPNRPSNAAEGVRGGTRLQVLEGVLRVSEPLPGTAVDVPVLTILKGQSATGIVGQIGRPAVRSGLLDELLFLKPEVHAHLDSTLMHLNDYLPELKKFIIEGQLLDLNDPPKVLDELARACAPVPSTPSEARWLRTTVLEAAKGNDSKGPWTAEKQSSLVRVLADHPELDHDSLPELAGKIEALLGDTPADRAVRAWLQDIVPLELLLGRMDDLFAVVRAHTREPKSREKLLNALNEQSVKATGWFPTGSNAQLTHALALLAVLRPDDLEAFHAFAEGLRTRQIGRCLDALVARNTMVVGRRNRRPWIHSCQDFDTGEITYTAEITSERSSLQAHKKWEHGFYLGELRNLVRQCRAGMTGEMST